MSLLRKLHGNPQQHYCRRRGMTRLARSTAFAEGKIVSFLLPFRHALS